MAEAASLSIGLHTTGADQATRALDGVSGALRRTHGDTLKLGAVMGATSAAVTAGLNAAANAAGRALDAIGQSAIGLNSRLEQANLAFTTMLGSGERAQAFLKELQAFAAQTPFEFPQLVDASKRMLAFGFEAEKVRPLLTAVGDAAAAMGSGAEGMNKITLALGQMQAKGKATAEEMMQLTEAGIPAWQMLADALGTDVAGAMAQVEKRTVDAATVIEAFQSGVASRFGGMMAEQAKTLQGAWSTITDSLQMAVANGFKPLFNVLSEVAQQVAVFLQSADFEAWATEAATWLGGVVEAARAWWTEMGPGIITTLQEWGGQWDALMGRLSAGVETATAPVQAILGIWQGVFQAIGQVTADESGEIISVWDRLSGFARDVLLPALDTLGAAWQVLWQEIQIQATHAINAVLPTVENLRAWLADHLLPAIAGLQEAWSGFWDQARPTVTATWAVVQPVLIGIKDFMGTVLLGILQEFKRRWDTTWAAIGQVWEVLAPILGPLAEKFGGLMAELNRQLHEQLKAMAPPAAAAAEETVAAVRQAFVQGIPPAAKEATAAVQATTAAVQAVGAASATAAGQVQPLTTATTATATAAKEAADALKAMLQSTDAATVSTGLWHQQIASFLSGALRELPVAVAGQVQALQNANDVTGAAAVVARELGVSLDDLWGIVASGTSVQEMTTAATRAQTEATKEATKAAEQLAAEQARVAQAGATAGEAPFSAILSAVIDKAPLWIRQQLEMTKAAQGVQAALEQAARMGLDTFDKAMALATGNTEAFRKALDEARKGATGLKETLSSAVTATGRAGAGGSYVPGQAGTYLGGGVVAPPGANAVTPPTVTITGYTGAGMPIYGTPGQAPGRGTTTPPAGMQRGSIGGFLLGEAAAQGAEGPRSVAEMEQALAAAQYDLWYAKHVLPRTFAPGQGEQARAAQANAITAAERAIEELTIRLQGARLEAAAFGQAGTRAGEAVAQAARNAIPEIGGLARAYDGAASAARTLAQLEATDWQARRARQQALTIGAAINPFGGLIPATGAGGGQNATTRGQTSGLGAGIYGVPNNIYGIPMFDRGGVMPWDGLAHLRRGETVTPASGGGGGGNLTIHYAPTYSTASDAEAERFVRGLERTLRRSGFAQWGRTG